MKIKHHLLFGFSFLQLLNAASYNCPILSCSNTLYKNRCLEVNFELPKD